MLKNIRTQKQKLHAFHILLLFRLHETHNASEFSVFFFQQAVSGTFEIGISNFENLLIWWTDAASSTFYKVFM